LFLFALMVGAIRIGIGGGVGKIVSALDRLRSAILHKKPMTLNIPHPERVIAFEMITCTAFSKGVAQDDFTKRDELVGQGYEIVWTGIQDSELWMYLVKYAPVGNSTTTNL
jgi:hypothetical protein